MQPLHIHPPLYTATTHSPSTLHSHCTFTLHLLLTSLPCLPLPPVFSMSKSDVFLNTLSLFASSQQSVSPPLFLASHKPHPPQHSHNVHLIPAIHFTLPSSLLFVSLFLSFSPQNASLPFTQTIPTVSLPHNIADVRLFLCTVLFSEMGISLYSAVGISPHAALKISSCHNENLS